MTLITLSPSIGLDVGAGLVTVFFLSSVRRAPEVSGSEKSIPSLACSGRGGSGATWLVFLALGLSFSLGSRSEHAVRKASGRLRRRWNFKDRSW